MKPGSITLALCLALLAAAPAAAQDAEADAVADPTAEADAEAVAEADADADAEAAAEAAAEADAAAAADAEAEAEAAAEAAADADAPAPADPEPQPSDAPAPSGPQFTFANSFFTWTTAATAHTFAPGAQLTYDPTVQMGFSLTPRFYLTDTTFLWMNQSMSLELTDSNFDTYNREPLLSDTLLDVRQMLPSWEGFVVQLQGRLGFPLSKASQSAQRILQTGLGLTIARPFPELAGFTVAVTGSYRRWWATSNVAQTQEAYPGQCVQPSPDEAPVCTQASGLTTARDILVAGLTMNVAPFSGFTVSFSGFYFGTYNFEIGDANVPINGGGVTVVDDGPAHWRHFTYFSLAVAYDVMPWLNLQLGIQNSGVVAPLFDDTGNVRSPFSPDTQIFLSTTIGLDSFVNEVAGGEEDDGLTPEQRQRRRQGLASTGGRSAF